MHKIMTHFVIGYPNIEESFQAAEAAIKGGAAFLELQFPFSDPTADGVLIQEACEVSIKQGFTMKAGFDFVARLREKYDIPIFVMSYAGLVFAYGVESFVAESARVGVTGLIVPDLPFDYDAGLYRSCKAHKIHCVPVVLSSSQDARLEKILALDEKYIYIVIRSGITGSKSEISPEVQSFLKKVRQRGKYVFAGFGISTPWQVEQLEGYCDACVVGSAIIRLIKAHPSDIKDYITSLVG